MNDDHATEGTAVPFLHPIRTAKLVYHVVTECYVGAVVGSIRAGINIVDKLKRKDNKNGNNKRNR